MDQATQELLFADIAAVGEPEIAEKYSKAAAEIDSTGNVDDEEDWEALFFRLECATARFLLQHADLFEEQEAQDPAKSEEN